MPDSAHLFSPLRIRDVTLRNRIAVSPMCQYSCEDGFANDWHLVHLGSRAVGGAGLVMVEATAVEPEGRISPGDHGLWKDAHIDMLKLITTFIKVQGSVPGIQIAHAGRKASVSRPWEGDKLISKEQGGWQIIAPSALPFHEGNPAPKELSVSEIAAIGQKFVDTAKRALTAGFEILEIHAAHGYLLHEFLSPLANKRSDEYGGSFENRIRFLRETVERVRAVWPERLPLFVRISASDWAEGGWTDNDSVKIAEILGPMGVDLIDCSSGGILPHIRIPTKPGYQVPFSEHIKNNTKLLTGAVGMITEFEQADTIIRSNQADIVLLARAFLHDPYWPLHAAQKLGADFTPPVQYERGFPKKKP